MSKYSGKPAIVDRPIGELFNRFKDLSFFEERVKELPEDQLKKLDNVKFTPDSISIATPQMGEMTFEVVERIEPTKVVFGAPNAPIKLAMNINFAAVDETHTEVQTEIDVDLPMMIRPLVGPKLQEAADKFGDMIVNLAK